MRTKEQHLSELDEAHAQLMRVLGHIRRTRSNVPMGSLIYSELMVIENQLSRARQATEHAFRYLEQHGYGGEVVSAPADTAQGS